MGANENTLEPELPDANKIRANIWAMSTSTQKLSELCETLQDVLTLDEHNQLKNLRDDHVKCFSLYSNFINGHHEVHHQSSLLKALRSTGNTTIADQIKTTPSQNVNSIREKANRSQTSVISQLEENLNQTLVKGHRIPSIVSYEVDGKNKIYASPDSLRISTSFQHRITRLTLTHFQISLEILKTALQPCLSLNELHLQNVLFSRSCTVAITEQSSSDTNNNNILVFPYLKKYTFYSDHENSASYTWDIIFFFSMFENNKISLLNLWKSQAVIDVNCKSMQARINLSRSVDGEDSSVFISFPKKEFYDAPNFVPYIESEYIHQFLKNLTNLKSLTCLLPDNFDSISFEDLPKSLSNFHISGLSINYKKYDTNQNQYKSYKQVQLERCKLSQTFLDDMYTVFPLAEKLQLVKCHVENSEGSDINITLK